MDEPLIAPISPALLAKQLPRPKPTLAFDSLAVGQAQTLPLEGTDLQWVRNAAKWRSRVVEGKPRRRFDILVNKAKNTIEIARLE